MSGYIYTRGVETREVEKEKKKEEELERIHAVSPGTGVQNYELLEKKYVHGTIIPDA